MEVSRLLCIGFLVAVGVLPAIVAYFVHRRTDPKHALRRAAGLAVVLLGSFALAGALAAFLMVLVDGTTLKMEAECSPSGSGWSQYSGVELGPVGLSVWLLLAGGTLALGLFLYSKRFSLRSMLIGLGLVALLASAPHVLIKPQDHVATVTVAADHILNEIEWEKLEEDLSRQVLCANLPEEVIEALDLPLEKAITKMEMHPLWYGEGQANGKYGAQLTIHFSRELDNKQTGRLFSKLCDVFEKAVPPNKIP